MDVLTIKTFKDESLIRQGEDKSRASILVKNTKLEFNGSGAVWERSRLAVWRVPFSLADGLNLVEGKDLNKLASAKGYPALKIIMAESIVPFYTGQEPKTRGEGGEVIKDDNGAPIYQEYNVVRDSDEFKDVKVERTLGAIAAEETSAENSSSEKDMS